MSLFFDTNNFSLDATPPDKGRATWSAIQDALSSTPTTTTAFESPLGVSSIGSPNSSRDFDESPLLPFDSEPALVNNFSLFDNSTPAATVPQPSAAPPAQQAAPNSYEDYHSILLKLYLKHQAEQQATANQGSSQPTTAIPAYLTEASLPSPSPSQQQQAHLLPNGPALLGHFANASSSPLEATSMGTAFASLSDIAPATKPWELPFAALQSSGFMMSMNSNTLAANKTMAESVSSQESIASKTSPGATTGTSPSTTSTPMSSQGSDNNVNTGTETISQLAAVFLREYARHRPAQDTSTLLRAFDVAGIAVADEVLEDVGVTSPFAAAAAPPSPPTKDDFSYTKDDGSTSSIFDDYFVGNQFAAQSPPPAHSASASASPPATKARSSAQHTSKHAALGDDTILVNGKRLFQCDVCQKTFDRAFNLKTHKMIHEDTREYNFICPFEECGKAFARKADCNRHTKTVHLKRGEKLPQGARADFG